MAKLLCICIGLTKFEENPEGSSIFCVDLTWNDPPVCPKGNMARKLSLKQLVCIAIVTACFSWVFELLNPNNLRYDNAHPHPQFHQFLIVLQTGFLLARMRIILPWLARGI